METLKKTYATEKAALETKIDHHTKILDKLE